MKFHTKEELNVAALLIKAKLEGCRKKLSTELIA
jgi:hypothetical protein